MSTPVATSASVRKTVSAGRSLPSLARSSSVLPRKAQWAALRASKPRHAFAARQGVFASEEVATTETKTERKPRRKVTVQMEDVAVGNTYTGSVTSVQSYGAFVNFGAKSDGLVHISELTTGFVESVEDVVSAGQEVEVRVLSIDTEKSRVALSMKPEGADAAAGEGEVGEDGRPVRRGKVATRGKQGGKPRNDTPPPVKKGQKYKGTVASLLPFGAFIKLEVEGAEQEVQGLLHVSEISEERVDNPADKLSEGQEVEVRVLNIQGSKLNLSMREQVDIAELNAAAIADLGETATAMEMALKMAGISRDAYGEADSA